MRKDLESTKFSLVVVSPDEVLFDGSAVKLIVPGVIQQLAILPDHTPLYAQLKRGTVSIETTEGQSEKLKIQGGVVRVRSNQVSVITGFEGARTPANLSS